MAFSLDRAICSGSALPTCTILLVVLDHFNVVSLGSSGTEAADVNSADDTGIELLDDQPDSGSEGDNEAEEEVDGNNGVEEEAEGDDASSDQDINTGDISKSSSSGIQNGIRQWLCAINELKTTVESLFWIFSSFSPQPVSFYVMPRRRMQKPVLHCWSLHQRRLIEEPLAVEPVPDQEEGLQGSRTPFTAAEKQFALQLGAATDVLRIHDRCTPHKNRMNDGHDNFC